MQTEEFIRTPTYASGPMTDEEKAQLAQIVAAWVAARRQTDKGLLSEAGNREPTFEEFYGACRDVLGLKLPNLDQV